ncbi:MAG: nucleoside hydrolase [Gemmataceae bacterium]
MPEKIVITADPGIDTAFAIALALHDPRLEVLGLAATAGNVSSDQATKNIHILIEQMDPPRWPKLGAALPLEYDIDGTEYHGPDGLGGLSFACSQLHNIHPSDKMLLDFVDFYPEEIVVVCMGPLTTLATALDRDSSLASRVKRVVCLGGTLSEPGNAGPVSEFHFTCDPTAARAVLQAGFSLTLIPLDEMRKLLFSPTDLLQLPSPNSSTCQFLKKIVPYGIRGASNMYGVEGFHLKDVLGVVAASHSDWIKTEPMLVDVESQGELTRGMMVVDHRRGRTVPPNVEMAVDVDVEAIRQYINDTLARTT